MVVSGVDLVFLLFVSQRVYWFMIFHYDGLSRADDQQTFGGSCTILTIFSIYGKTERKRGAA